MYVSLFSANKITYKYRFNQIYCDLFYFSLQNCKTAIIKHLQCTFNAFAYYFDSLIYKRFKFLSLRKKKQPLGLLLFLFYKVAFLQGSGRYLTTTFLPLLMKFSDRNSVWVSSVIGVRSCSTGMMMCTLGDTASLA